MPSSFLRPLTRCATRVKRTSGFSKSPYSTQRPGARAIYRSKPFLAGAALLIGVPVSFSLGKSYHNPPELPSKNKLGALYEGSLDWKGKIVPPCTMKDVEAWLVKE